MINEDVPGIEVAVQIGGVDAVEYDCAPEAEDDWTKVTKYIECSDGAEFSVRVRVSNTYDWTYNNHCLSAFCYVDGKWVRTPVFHNPNRFHRTRTVATIEGPEEQDNHGQWSRRNFRFSSVTIIDDTRKARIEEDQKRAKVLGAIEVKIERGTPLGSAEAPLARARDGQLEIAEKALKGKAISHSTSYSAGQSISSPSFIEVRRLPEDDGPIAVFRFLYRSREALKSELVIPRTPPPRSPTLAALPEAERDRLARERLDELRRIKHEGKNGIKRELNAVYDLTQEGAPKRPAKMTRLASGRAVEVVDLTED